METYGTIVEKKTLKGKCGVRDYLLTLTILLFSIRPEEGRGNVVKGGGMWEGVKMVLSHIIHIHRYEYPEGANEKKNFTGF